MKVLALCHSGAVRSRAMANELHRRGFRAMYGGLGLQDKRLLKAQMKWADRIIVMDESLLPKVPPEFKPKVTLADLGADVWGNPDHPDLKNRVRVITDEWQRENWSFQPLRLKPKGPIPKAPGNPT